MFICTVDDSRVINVGSSDILFSFYSTIMIKLKPIHKSVPMALLFLQNGNCNCNDALECARQINLIRDALSQINPKDAVYDMNDRSKAAPWKDNISAVVTSCGNMFSTADGDDLISEIVSLLVYSYYKRTSVVIR